MTVKPISGSPKGLGLLILGLLVLTARPSNGEAVQLYVSLAVDDVIHGMSYDEDDVIFFDTVTNTSSLFFDGDTVFKNPQEDLDAFYLFPNGDLLFSTATNAQIGSLSFTDADLVRVNPVTKAATLFFDGSTVFQQNVHLRAVDILPDGKLVFAASNGDITSNGLAFSQKDLVLYDPVTGDASLLFDGSDHFATKKGAIHGVDVLPDGRLVLIVWGDAGRAAVLGGEHIGRRDIVLYDPASKTLEEVLVNGDDILAGSRRRDQGFDAVFVPAPIPEPMTATLFGLGLLGTGLRCRKRYRAISAVRR